MTDVLKLKYNLSETNFKYFEVSQVSINSKRSFVIQIQQNRKPRLIFTGIPYRVFNVTIITELQETIDKIEALRDHRGIIEFYWDYANNPEQCTGVKILPGVPSFYAVGLKAAKTEIELTFIETWGGVDRIAVLAPDDRLTI